MTMENDKGKYCPECGNEKNLTAKLCQECAFDNILPVAVLDDLPYVWDSWRAYEGRWHGEKVDNGRKL